MFGIDAKKLVNAEAFVREPVDKETNNILQSKNNKIIVTGSRGSGKSTILRSIENRGLGTKEQTIYYVPEHVVPLPEEPNEVCNRDIFNYYYEISFTKKLLIYIKINYPLAFEKYFKTDDAMVTSFLNEFSRIYNNSMFEEPNYLIRFNTKELSSNILNKFCEKLEIENVNLAIDKYDNRGEYVQELHKNYFDMFDKVILAPTDSNLNIEDLTNKEYDVRKIEYAKDKDVLKEIIKRRINEYNHNKRSSDESVNINLFTQDTFIDKLLELDGNITLYLDVLRKTNTIIQYSESYNLDEVIDSAIEYVKEENNKIERYYKPPVLYL